jgi:hypothetical protein
MLCARRGSALEILVVGQGSARDFWGIFLGGSGALPAFGRQIRPAAIRLDWIMARPLSAFHGGPLVRTVGRAVLPESKLAKNGHVAVLFGAYAQRLSCPPSICRRMATFRAQSPVGAVEVAAPRATPIAEV